MPVIVADPAELSNSRPLAVSVSGPPSVSVGFAPPPTILSVLYDAAVVVVTLADSE